MKNSVKLSCLAVVVSTVWSGCTAGKKPSQAAAPPAAAPSGADMDRGLAGTRMMCGPDSTRQESEYLKALADVDRYEIRNRLTLYLYLKNSDQPLKFHAVL